VRFCKINRVASLWQRELRRKEKGGGGRRQNSKFVRDLGTNNINGTIPNSVWNLKSLETLYPRTPLSSFSSFSFHFSGFLYLRFSLALLWFPTIFFLPWQFYLTIARDFRLTNLTGTIPDTIGNWINITEIELYASIYM
jgi:hypothetical protein